MYILCMYSITVTQIIINSFLRRLKNNNIIWYLQKILSTRYTFSRTHHNFFFFVLFLIVNLWVIDVGIRTACHEGRVYGGYARVHVFRRRY